MKRRVLLFGLIVAAAGALAAYVVLRPITREPQHFKDAVRLLADSLQMQLVRHRGLQGGLSQVKGALGAAPAETVPVAVAPFIDANFGEAVKASKDVERLVSDRLDSNGAFRVEPLTPASLAGAQYVLFGVLLLDDYYTEKGEIERRYHIIASAVDHRTRRIAAQASIWIAESDLDYTPEPLYRDSPMFPRDQRLASLVAIARGKPGTPADREYYDSLETNALMAEAESAFDAADYAHARTLFKQATERSDGRVMKAYLGLYRSDIKLDDLAAAEAAFAKLVAVGADNGLNTKFLFGVNSTGFIADPSLRVQYNMWTRQIGRYFSTDGRCIEVVGHCSHTGAAGYNDRLSLVRAEMIRNRIARGFPAVAAKSKALGKGYRENIVGSGTDDQRDALDRRVEVVVVNCPQP